ncbi:MAG: hypothetical protein C0483_20730 [Pirellula sp.]|nr:hypothetical protein [Pirellula sp.]
MGTGLMKSFYCLLVLSVTLFLCNETCAAEPAVKTLLLLGQKPDGHAAGSHEYMPGQRILQHLLGDVPGWKIEIVQADGEWPQGPELLAKADAVVLFVSEGGRWVVEDPRRYDAFAKLAARGGGISGLHWGVGVKDPKKIAPFVQLLGACHGGADRKFRVIEGSIQVPDSKHPVVRGVVSTKLRDEYYFALKREPKASEALVPLITVSIDGVDEMIGWAWQRPDGGRSFGFTGLHFHKAWEKSAYRRLVAQGVLWTMGQEIPAAGVDVAIPAELLALPK